MVGDSPIKISKGMTFDSVPDDKYQLEVLAVEAVKQMNYAGTAEEERLKYRFGILDPEKTMKSKDSAGKETEVPLRGRFLWTRFSKNLTVPGSPKLSNLTKFIFAVYGRELNEKEMEVWEPEDVLHMQVSALVDREADKKDPSVFWNNIKSFSHTDKVMELLPASDKDAKDVSTVKKSAPVKTTPDDFEKEMSEKKAKV